MMRRHVVGPSWLAKVATLAFAILACFTILVGLVLTPLAIARAWCYRKSERWLVAFRDVWRDRRPIEVDGPNREIRRRAASGKGALGFGFRGRR